MAYAISLTSIPPRLPRIGPVLESLLAQRPAPVAVYLCLPKVWSRFGQVPTPVLTPDGVEVLRANHDPGPALKALTFSSCTLNFVSKFIYCDDDWIYPETWASTLLDASSPDEAVAASGFNVDRLKRKSPLKSAAHVDIAQGFAGVCVDPKWLCGADVMPPKPARFADDIWLSGQLARKGIPIRLCPGARAGLRPAFEDEHGLQDITTAGKTRAEANLAALNALTERYGIWLPMEG